MVEIRQNAPFNEYLFDSPLIDKFVQKHLFESVIGPRTLNPRIHFLLKRFILELDLENSAISTVTNFASWCEVLPDQWP